ncbi:2',3'-cyclic-nucleotide 2'-phosphodiesterase (5'-nucleotidase family) [Sinorhizobium kostiense]|uniref:2',3'-cyclic-nucleotide 2'-phosphodiesterase (5'-nucleotidase family) n=1 Tax=Sinorhizobium kostiense TaxID=76747 RepID=A0ABS4QZU4_9HYPH|nr:2',3'-cyclic-nucleotide 2'-phosphodiesterase (5'-nucleotidase family) [Sinorhizobium kostiense]
MTVPTMGKGGLKAAAELGIDLSVIGNHDLDFGVEFLRREATDLGFPLLSANAEIGFPATAILPISNADVGIIGLTHHNLSSMSSWTVRPERHMPGPEVTISFDVRASAEELRKSGASIVVCVCHDGVDWHYQNGRYLANPGGFFQRCATWHKAVDLIVAGHTLGRFFGYLGNTPVVQPWPLGSEIAVVDVELSKGRPVINTWSHFVQPNGQQWSGVGSEIIKEAEGRILGELPEGLASRSHEPGPLVTLLARAVQAVSGGADISFAYTTCGQPILDGVFSWLGKGPVAWLQILQVVPYTDFRIVETDVTRRELEILWTLTLPRLQDRTTAWGASGTIGGGDTFRIATLSGAATDLFSRILNRTLHWRETGATFEAGLQAVLRRRI